MFPIAALTNYLRVTGLKYYLTVLEVRSPKVKVSAELWSFWRTQGKVYFLAFSRFYRSPAFLGPRPLPGITRTSALSITSSSLTPTLLQLSHKDSRDFTGPKRVIQDHFPITRSLTRSHLQSLICHVKYHIYRVGYRYLLEEWNYYSASHISQEWNICVEILQCSWALKELQKPKNIDVDSKYGLV